MKPLKIVYVLPCYWPLIGGCEIHTHELVKRLCGRHEIRVITLMNKPKDKECLGGFLYAGILSAPSVEEVYYDHKAKVTKMALSMIEKYYAFFMLRIQSPKMPLFVRRCVEKLFTAFYKSRLTKLIGDCDLIHGIHGEMSWIGYVAMEVAKERGIPFVFTSVAHLFDKEEVIDKIFREKGEVLFSEFPPHLKNPSNNFLFKTCSNADVLISMTDYEKEFFVRNEINKNIRTLGVGPVVSDEPEQEVKVKYGIEGKPLVLFLGRVNELKGVESLLKAALIVWEQLNETQFFFVGPIESGAKDFFKEYNDARIIATGPFDVHEKSAVLKACDVLCVPSVVESLGGVFLEAWYFGKPVIGADIPPFRELTENGKGGGIAVKPNPDDIANAILHLLKNPETAAELGAWGKKQVSNKYSWDVICEKLESIYFELLGVGKE